MPPSDFESYAQTQPEVAQLRLRQMRSILCAVLPESEDIISYSMPALRWNGKVALYYAVWKRHIALYPASASILTEFAHELAAYSTSKGSIRFPLDIDLPIALISEIARRRRAQIESIKKAKRAKAPA